jgi:hypothetical protein
MISLRDDKLKKNIITLWVKEEKPQQQKYKSTVD